MSAFLSGEMRDTVQMNPAGSYGALDTIAPLHGLIENAVLERFFSRAERRKLFLSWAGSASMWIKGGNTIWGNTTFAPDDDVNATHTHGELVSFRHVLEESYASEQDSTSSGNLTTDDAITWILQHTPATFQVRCCNDTNTFR